MTKKNFEEFYDSDAPEVEVCNKCHSYMFPEEIINITEHKIKKYLNHLNLYINDKDRVIPANYMSILGITLEGSNENGKCEAVILDLSEENYKKIWNRGKELWNKNLTSKYLICFLERDKCFRYNRPDIDKFEKYYRLDNYMQYDEALEIFNSENKYYLIKDSLDEICKKYKVEEVFKTVPQLERSDNELEYS